jgi:hypothetical protein
MFQRSLFYYRPIDFFTRNRFANQRSAAYFVTVFGGCPCIRYSEFFNSIVSLKSSLTRTGVDITGCYFRP